MASSRIVRHDAMRFLGTFDADLDIYGRGQEVIVRTDRGLEIGQLLCATTPRAVELIHEPTRARIIRLLAEREAPRSRGTRIGDIQAGLHFPDLNRSVVGARR